MRAEPTPEPGDRAKAPFSNGTMGEMFLGNVCAAGRGCVHDSTWGQADPEGETYDCPLITLSLFGVWPREWPDDPSVSYSTPGSCTEFTEDWPEPPGEPPVVAVDLFGVFQAEPRCPQPVENPVGNA